MNNQRLVTYGIQVRWRHLLFLSFLIFSYYAHAQAPRADYRIIPLPKSEVTDTAHCFSLLDGMDIAYDATNSEVARNAAFLQGWVEELTGLKLVLAPANQKPSAERESEILAHIHKLGKEMIAACF